MIRTIGAMLGMAILLALGACNTRAPGAGDASPPADIVDDSSGIGGY